ncbi:hypothetical protein IH601_08065 [Candidatus Bipolaricaulota bacterium]|nr:hypothetical protein [Candidatus Bipolaricaulota bacterium]TFH10639.1 MAG: hypothetical protein E4H08_03180 [Candidatus Atribacteria bacterium]
MKIRLGILCLIGVVLLGWSAMTVGQDVPPVIRLLLIDETKTFTSTMKVAGTIGALRQMGLFEVSVRLAEGFDDYADPLAGTAPEKDQEPYDLVLILPRGLDTQSGVSIWLVSDWLTSLSPFVRGAIDLVSNVVDQVFAGSGQTIDVSEDLWPDFLWADYAKKGWVQ